jgi:hypothetical protein
MAEMKNIFAAALKETKKIHASIEDRVDTMEFRVSALEALKPIVKVAFDTRRTNQYTDFNPRRNLQYYHRSEPFITKDSAEKIKTFFKLKMVVDGIKEDFNGDPEYLDSYCRILSNALDRTLRIEQNDMDFGKPQMDYLEELLYLRYRLKDEDIVKLNEKDLRNVILDRDEKLLHKQIYANYNNGGLMKNNNQNVVIKQDNLVEKLLGEVRANKDNKNVRRSVTVTVNDELVDEIKKNGGM